MASLYYSSFLATAAIARPTILRDSHLLPEWITTGDRSTGTAVASSPSVWTGYRIERDGSGQVFEKLQYHFLSRKRVLTVYRRRRDSACPLAAGGLVGGRRTVESRRPLRRRLPNVSPSPCVDRVYRCLHSSSVDWG